jgi:hypothetical protein
VSYVAVAAAAAAEVAQRRSRALLRLAKFEQLHNAYRDCLGLAIRSEKGNGKAAVVASFYSGDQPSWGGLTVPE